MHRRVPSLVRTVHAQARAAAACEASLSRCSSGLTPRAAGTPRHRPSTECTPRHTEHIEVLSAGQNAPPPPSPFAAAADIAGMVAAHTTPFPADLASAPALPSTPRASAHAATQPQPAGARRQAGVAASVHMAAHGTPQVVLLEGGAGAAGVDVMCVLTRQRILPSPMPATLSLDS